MQTLAAACPQTDFRLQDQCRTLLSRRTPDDGRQPAGTAQRVGDHRFFDRCTRTKPSSVDRCPPAASIPHRGAGGHHPVFDHQHTPAKSKGWSWPRTPNRPGRTFTTASPFPTGRRTAPNWQSPPAHSPLAGGCRSPALRPVCTHTKPGWSQTARAHGRPFPTTHLTYPHATIGQGLPETRLPAPTTMPGPLAAPTRPPAVEPVMVPEP